MFDMIMLGVQEMMKPYPILFLYLGTVAGIIGMLISCQVPRWQAQRKLRATEAEARPPAG